MGANMMWLSMIPMIFLLFLFGFGWAFFLITGIVLRRKGRKSGKVMLWVGSIWLFCVVAGAVVAGVAIYHLMAGSRYEVEEFDSVKYDGPTGLVSIACKNAAQLEMKQSGEKKRWKFSSENGEFSVPAGVYELGWYNIEAVSESGAKWRAFGYRRWGNAEIEVKEGATVSLELGPPFRAVVEIGEVESGKLNLGMEITDRYGCSISFSQMDYSARKTPGFKALDESGAVVWSGSFAYS